MVSDLPQTGLAAKAVRPGGIVVITFPFFFVVVASCHCSMLRYGGYPCGLWSLWHSLTISQAAAHAGDPRFLKPLQTDETGQFKR